MIKYGILDYMGKVVRWVWEKPADQYPTLTMLAQAIRMRGDVK